MQVSYPGHTAVFQSWETSDRTTLIVMHLDNTVRLQHLAPGFGSKEATIIDLSSSEAADVAQRIVLVLRGEQVENPPLSEEGSNGARLVITYTNDGEPFREGVSLAIDTGSWQKDFGFSMSQATARELVSALQHSPTS